MALELSHVAGERNEEADLLSRLNHPEAKPWPLVMRAKFPEAKSGACHLGGRAGPVV